MRDENIQWTLTLRWPSLRNYLGSDGSGGSENHAHISLVIRAVDQFLIESMEDTCLGTNIPRINVLWPRYCDGDLSTSSTNFAVARMSSEELLDHRQDPPLRSHFVTKSRSCPSEVSNQIAAHRIMVFPELTLVVAGLCTLDPLIRIVRDVTGLSLSLSWINFQELLFSDVCRGNGLGLLSSIPKRSKRPQAFPRRLGKPRLQDP